MRHLRPWWVRLYRLFGLRPKPPILFSLTEHFCWEGTSIAVVAVASWIIGLWDPAESPYLLILFCAMAVGIPLANWLIRRRIRARIGQ
jgi:hypothetical protein